MQVIKETKSWFFEKINKIHKLLANLTSMRRQKTKSISLETKKGISQLTASKSNVFGDYFENLCANKLENLEETGKFQDVFDLPKLNKKDINHLNGTIF
jgi:hypothetical protein